MKTTAFPLTITEQGVTAKIREVRQTKGRQQYKAYVVEYILLGKRKQEWRADLDEARQAASEACRRIAGGEQHVLQLNNHDRLVYLRAVDALKAAQIPLDIAAAEFARAIAVLNGKATVVEAAREYAARHAVVLQKIMAPDAVEKFLDQIKAEGGSEDYQTHLGSALNRFAEAFNVEVGDITPSLISAYLTSLPLKERTKRNHRDIIGCFSRWLVLRGYLSKGTDLLEGVQKYNARKTGEITTYTAEEMAAFLESSGENILTFLVIAGFAGLRHAEIARLDWKEIDLEEGFIEVKAENAKTETRRIVPIKDNLKAWLTPRAKAGGPVMGISNIASALYKLSKRTGIRWKHNALRHTYISARVAECADIARVADEAGNSPQIIRTNYLKRMRPALATAWFSIHPKNPENVVPVAAEQQFAA